MEIRPARECSPIQGKLDLLELNFYKDDKNDTKNSDNSGETEFWSQRQRKKPKLDPVCASENSLVKLENFVNLEKNNVMVSFIFSEVILTTDPLFPKAIERFVFIESHAA